MRTAVILLLMAFCPVSLLAGLPDAPTPAPTVDPAPTVNDADAAFVSPAGIEPIHPKQERAWLMAGFTLDAAARGIDAYSTCRALKNQNNQEMILPDKIVKSQPALYGFDASVVLTEYLGYRLLTAHHHEKIARWLPYVDAALVLPFAVHNLSLSHRAAANVNNGPAIDIRIR